MENQEKRELELKMLSQKISYYRRLKGITQEELAARVNVSRNHISRIEARNLPTHLSIDLLLEIADALDVSPALLLEFGDTKYIE